MVQQTRQHAVGYPAIQRSRGIAQIGQRTCAQPALTRLATKTWSWRFDTVLAFGASAFAIGAVAKITFEFFLKRRF